MSRDVLSARRMAIDGQVLGALLLMTGRPVELRRSLWRRKARPAPKPKPRRPVREARATRLPKPVPEPPTSRRCTDCGEAKGLDAFLPITSSRYVYGRCRICRNRRARERYHANPDARAAEISRSQRNQRRRAAERRAG
jgi:hypothetical protein